MCNQRMESRNFLSKKLRVFARAKMPIFAQNGTFLGKYKPSIVSRKKVLFIPKLLIPHIRILHFYFYYCL